MRPVDACIVDLDGTVYLGSRAIDGAAEALAGIRRAGIALRFATNTTRFPRRELVSRVQDLGVEILEEELHTAPVAAAGYLADQRARRVSLLLAEATYEEFDAFTVDEANADHVVVGDLGEAWDFARLNTAFRALLAGARLVAIQKNRYWDPGDGLKLDAGPFVAALEYATGQEAVVVGKPALPFYRTAMAGLGVAPARIAVVGDSVENDVRAGQAAGCLGVAVRTGTFREEHLAGGGRSADGVLDSIADLPGWLGL